MRSFFVLLSLLLIGELVTRLAIMSPSAAISDPDLGWIWRPGTEVFHTKEGWARNRVNDAGFNDAQLQSSVSGKSNVLVIGDSFTEAMQVPREANFVSKLNSAHKCHNFINAGRSGVAISHFPLLAQRFSELVDYSEIVLVVNRWDPAETLTSSGKVVRDDNGKVVAIEYRFKQPHPIRQRLEPLFANSALATYLLERAKKLKASSARKDYHKERATKSEQELVQRKKQQHEEFAEIAEFVFSQLNGRTKVTLVFLPHMNWHHPKRGSAQQGEHKRLATEHPESVEVAALFKRIADETKIPVLTLEKHYLRDYEAQLKMPVGFANAKLTAGHLNSHGHTVVADAITKGLGLSCPGDA